jgi:O-antigen/teichoic acid export membrane protein
MDDDTAPVATTPTTPSLLRSGALSLVTSAVPLVVALAALPLLTRQLGTERLGLLALAWAWLGYATLLDFGLGRALTRLVAGASDRSATQTTADIGALVVTAHWALTAIGAAVGMASALIAPWYVNTMLHVSAALRDDAVISAVIFALTVPAVTGASIPRAVLEARHEFRAVNLIRLPVNAGTFALPLLLLPFTASLTGIAASMALLRLWAWWQYAKRARVVLPESRAAVPATAQLRPLLRAGAWMTVSNVVSPLMTVVDRFLIGSVISVSAVALYAVPWEAVTKLWIVPGAVTMVLFPSVSRLAAQGAAVLSPLHRASARLVALLVVPPCALAALFAPELLRLAGGGEYTGQSATVLRLLCVGVAANCMASIPFALLQACGRARWTAMVHLLELTPYLALLWYAVQRWGIAGAAATWTARAVGDAAVMMWRADAEAPLPGTAYAINLIGVLAVAACAWLGARSGGSVRPSVVAAALVVAMLPFLLWSQRSGAERLVLGATSRRA